LEEFIVGRNPSTRETVEIPQQEKRCTIAKYIRVEIPQQEKRSKSLNKRSGVL